ncbi:MAG: twin-arginine translocation signal domain-containing protein [Firmicutes bacterium]|nr:twin-arginine translocation signal domain-containing protein [Bacillota bacterium]
MNAIKEVKEISRRQFLKGIGVLAGTAVIGTVFLKFGKIVYARSDEYIKLRAAALYQNDAGMPIRKSHENPEIKAIYAEFLGKPLSEKSEHLLHTHYVDRYVKLAG